MRSWSTNPIRGSVEGSRGSTTRAGSKNSPVETGVTCGIASSSTVLKYLKEEDCFLITVDLTKVDGSVVRICTYKTNQD